MEDIINILREHPIFAGMDEETLARIASKAKPKHINTGEVLIYQGEEQIDLFILRSGKVEVTITKASPDPDLPHTHRITTLTAGQTIGELSFIDQLPRSASVVALEPSSLFVLPGSEFKKLATKEVYMAISKNLAQSLRKTNEVTVQSLKNELRRTKQNANAGLFVTYLLLILVIYIMAGNLLRKLVVDPETSMYASAPLILLMAMVFFMMIKRFHYPYQNFGLTWQGAGRGIVEAVIFSIPVCLLITLVKWLIINNSTTFYHFPLFISFSSITTILDTTPSMLIIGIAIYAIFVPLQEFIARGVLQTSFQDLFVDGNPWKSNFIASALFASLHTHISPHLAFVMFFPSLLWGWLFMRNKTLIAPIVSHILIGWWSFFVVGVEKILVYT